VAIKNIAPSSNLKMIRLEGRTHTQTASPAGVSRTPSQYEGFTAPLLLFSWKWRHAITQHTYTHVVSQAT